WGFLVRGGGAPVWLGLRSRLDVRRRERARAGRWRQGRGPVASRRPIRRGMSVPAQSLARTLRLRDLIFIVVGTVIGSGIFVVPGAVLRDTGGDVGYALLVWALGG